jgi:DNA-binding SARP family transcriptional activator/tetratricopeptide (TPR) repeat protein
MLRILLLGTPAVYLDDELVRIQRRMQRALLFYLATQTDLVGRSQLIVSFWPEASETDGRRHLREALSKLRAQLDDDAYWIIYNDRIGLNFQNVYVDMHEFQNLIQQTWRNIHQIPNPSPLPEAMVQMMIKGVNLWRSPRFLSGANLPSTVEFERWFYNIGQINEAGRLQMLERLAHHAAATGDVETGIYWMRLALEYDELNENYHCQILMWMRDLSRRGDMLSYRNYLRELYKREMGGNPPPVLLEVFRKIQEEDSVSKPRKTVVWPSSLSLQLPFVGRIRGLQMLRVAFQRGGSAGIFGEAGAGKSRIVHQFYISLEQPPRLFLAIAHASEKDLPFQPIIEMLRKSILEREWQQLDSTWLISLSQLLPELLNIRPAILPGFQTGMQVVSEARAALFEAFRQILMIASKSQRILFFLDDAQWSDESTLAAMAYLQERQFFNSRGLFVLAARQEEPNPSLEQFLNRPNIQPELVCIDLHSLAMDEIADLARSALGQVPSDDLVERLARDTGGNPLFLIEILRAWLDLSLSGGLTETMEGLPLSSSIQNLLRQRLRNFSAESQLVLATAAVIGHQFTPDVLENAVGLDPERVVQILEDLERGYLIRAGGHSTQSAGWYMFIHDKLREVLLLDLSPARRRLLNYKVARALEMAFQGQIPQQAVVLAGHYEMAGQSDLAYTYWLQAAQYARNLFSRTEAYTAYRRAEQILQRIQLAIKDRDVYALYSGWGEIAFDSNDVETLRRVYTSLLRQGEQRRSPLLLGSAMSGLAMAYTDELHAEQSLKYINDAIPYLEQSEDVFEQMEVYNRKGNLMGMMDRYDEAVEAYLKAVELGQNAQDPHVQEARVNSEDSLSHIYTVTGWPAKALELTEHTFRERRLLLHATGQTRTDIVYSMASFYCGNYQQALKQCQRGLKIADTIGSWRYSGTLRAVAARTELALGHFDECWEHLSHLLDIGRRFGDKTMLSNACGIRGDFFTLMGCVKEAIESYQQGIVDNVENFTEMRNKYRLGALIAVHQDLEKGRKMIDQVIEYSQRVGMGMILMPALLIQIWVSFNEGTFDQADQVLEKVILEAEERRMGTILLTATSNYGAYQLNKGRLEEAWKNAQQVIQGARLLPNLTLEIDGLQLAIEVCAKQGGDPAPLQERLVTLLNELDLHTSSPELRPYFETYRDRILKLTNSL